MRGYVAPTDQRWFDFHAERRPAEVNFWKPSGRPFAALSPGEPIIFKLKAPHHAIGGYGYFALATPEPLPIWLAWEAFGEGNGVASEAELVRRVAANRASPESVSPITKIGCISLVQPTFFAPEEWVEAPKDWSSPIVSGKTYDLSAGEGHRLWQACVTRSPAVSSDQAAPRYGQPTLVRPRLGQGSFRLAVYEAYDWACAVTGEHSLPVLEAAHIRPYAQEGTHEVSNGLSLRRDLHRLFDLGYVTVTPDLVFRVSDRLRVEYDNGKTYYAHEGQRVHVPALGDLRPDRTALEWHNDVVFRAS